MGKGNTISEKLRLARLAYEGEISGKKERFRTSLADISKKIDDVQGFDYAEKYRKRYVQLLQSMEAFFARINKIEEATHGLKFKTTAYCRTLSPKGFAKGQVEDEFARIAQELSLIIDQLSLSNTIEGYEPILKKFCTLLVDMRYIAKNADRLLKESGLPEDERQSDLAPLIAKKKQLGIEQVEAVRMDNLECYSILAELKEEIQSNASRLSDDRLGSGKFYFDTKYRYLLGFAKEKFASEDINFAKEVLGLEPSYLASNAIYFEPEKGKKNIVINVHAADMSKPLYKSLLRNIYFSIASRLPANTLQYTYIACDVKTSAFLQQLENNIKNKLGKKDNTTEGEYIYRLDGYESSVKEESQVVKALSKYISDAISIAGKVESEGSIYEYNRTANTPMPLRTIFIDNYPSGFYNNDSCELLSQLLGREGSEYSGRAGYFTVISQNVDKPKINSNGFSNNQFKCPTLGEDDEDCSVVIDITDPDHITIDGVEAELNITTADFEERNYWEKLNAYYVKKEDFLLSHLFDNIDAMHSNYSVSPFDEEKISIPLGYQGKNIYNFEIPVKNAGHIFVVGGSGSGKSSFMHTFIFSTAYKYSPKDVQFYLADYKNTEFSFYKGGIASPTGEQAVRLPHVHYLQDKSSVPDFVAFIKMVTRVMNDRNALFKSLGCESIITYNKRMKAEGKETLPYIFVIVDEYQSMLEAAMSDSSSRNLKKEWKEMAISIAKLSRSAGMALVLVGQVIDSDLLTTFPYRVALSAEEGFENMFHSGNTIANKDLINEERTFLSVKKEGRTLIGTNATNSKPVATRTAYSGDHEHKVPLSIRIAEKYKAVKVPEIILGGAQETFNVDKISNPPYDHMNDPIIPFGGTMADCDTRAFPMYIGVSTVDATPTPMQFTADRVPGYAVYTASRNHMERILNVIMLSFLYKTGLAGFSYSGQRIDYFSTKENYREDIGYTINANPVIGEHIAFNNVKSGIIECTERLMELYKLYKKRIRQDTPDGGFTPQLILIHDFYWLEEEGLREQLEEYYTQRAEDLKQAQAAAENKPSEEEIKKVMAELKEGYDLVGMPYDEIKLRNDAVASLSGKTTVKKEVIKTNAERYDEGTVRRVVSELFKFGSSVSIFVVAASGIKSEWDKFKRMTGVNSYERVVYGTYKEAEVGLFSDPVDNDDGPDTLCYVYPGGIMTRLYSFNEGDNPVWWRKLNSFLK